MGSDLDQLAPTWLAAARDARIAGDLDAVYAMASDAIEARGPACWASGRCCNFKAAGHRLYVTGLEAAYTIARLPPGSDMARALRDEPLSAARDAGTCPFLLANLCGVHTIKPVGCRVYFCDRSAQNWQHDLSERLLGMVRAIHDRHGLEYRYDEWLTMLGAFK